MERLNNKLVAPCGINCGVCRAHLRERNRCTGCNLNPKVSHCQKCRIRLCKERKSAFCFNCDNFPCQDIKRLDKRYREKYDVNVIENLEIIRDKGVGEFVKLEQKKWQSSKGLKCMHDNKYY